MALTITDNSVRQINAALLSLEKKIGETNSEKAQDKQVVQMELKNTQYNFMAPLYQSGNSVSINTTGTWEGNARSATNAEHASTADNVEHANTADSATTATSANTATNANISKTLDTVNGDKLQIGSGTAQNVTNAKHAATTDYATNAGHASTADNVEHANTSDTATNAEHAATADNAKNMYGQTLDLSALDNTKFYPIFCESRENFAEVAIHSPSFGGHEPYNQNRIHFDISTFGWKDVPYTLNIREYGCFDNSEITIGCIGRGTKDGGWAIWLRGGLKYSCWTRNCTLSLKTSDYTYGNEIYTVGTNYYGGTNSNVNVVFTPQSTIKIGAYSNRPIVAPNITSIEQRTASLESNKVNTTELDEKLNSPLPWRYNYLGTGYSPSLHYRKIGEGNFTYPTGYWSFYSEIEMLYHIPNGVVVRGTIFVSLRGNGSDMYFKTVKYNSENGVFNYLSKTKVNYKLDTTNKRIYLEFLAYCETSYTMFLFRNSLTRTGDMLFHADNFWTFAANGTYTQSATTMQAGTTDGYTEIPLELISVDKYGRDITTTYATKTELTKAVPTYSADDAGKSLAVNSDGTGTEWVNVPGTGTNNTAYLRAGNSSSSDNGATTNGNTYLKIVDGGNVSSSLKISGSGGTSVTSDSDGTITINSPKLSKLNSTSAANLGFLVSGAGFGKNDTSHYLAGDGTWVKPQTIKFVDYKTGQLTFSSLTDQKKIELSNFGPEVTENNVLNFMTIYWNNIHIIAQADWATSQGTGSSGMACALHSLNTGTGYAVIRCVYLA